MVHKSVKNIGSRTTVEEF